MCRVSKAVVKPAPTIRHTISRADVEIILRRATPNANIHISDDILQLCDITDIDRFIQQDDTNKGKYTPELHDCDDFAYQLFGQMNSPEWSSICFGFLWTDTHAMNWCIDANEDFWLIEPQTDGRQSLLTTGQGNIITFMVV